MFMLRLLALLVFAAVVGCVAVYLFTGNRIYLGWAWRILRVAVGLALLVFALMILERFAVVVL